MKPLSTSLTLGLASSLSFVAIQLRTEVALAQSPAPSPNLDAEAVQTYPQPLAPSLERTQLVPTEIAIPEVPATRSQQVAEPVPEAISSLETPATDPDIIESAAASPEPPSPVAAHPPTPNIPEVEDLPPVSTHAADLVAQDAPLADQVTEITGVTLESTATGVEIKLSAPAGSTLQPVTQVEGNTVVTEIENAVLALPEGQPFRQDNPAAGIAEVTVSQVTSTRVQVKITGTVAAPVVDVVTGTEGLVLATTPEGDGEEVELVVTGKRDRKVQLPVVQTSISREAFEKRNNRRVGDVLEQLPGVVVVGPPGENKDVRLRGLDKEFTRTEFNGVTLPDGGEKREFQVNRLPSAFIDKISVIRNPTAEFESDGIAGRISLTTRPIPEDLLLEGRVGYGRNDRSDKGLWNAEFVVGDKPVDQFGFLAGFSFFQEPISISKDKLFTNGKRELEEELKDRTNIDFIGDLGFFYDQGEVHLQPLISIQNEDKVKTKLNTEPKKDSTREDETEDKDFQTVGLGITHKHEFNSGIRLDSNVGYYVSTEEKDKVKAQFKQKAGVGAFNLEKTEFEVEDKEDKTWNLATALTIPIQSGVEQEIKIGAAVRLRDRFRDKTKVDVDTKGKITNTATPKDNYSISENYFAFFAQDKLQVTERFSITPGVRLEHVPRITRDGTGREVSNTDTDINPSLHLLWNPIDAVNLHAAVSRGVNRPKFDELAPFVDERNDRFVIGSPNLEPARSWNFDIGGDYATEHLFLGINLFHREIIGVIEEVDTGTKIGTKRVFQVENVGDGWTNGVELEQRLNLGLTKVKALEGFTLWANQTFLRSELTDAQGVKRPFKEQPDFLANVGLDYTYEPWGTTLTISWGYISESTELRADGTTKTIEATSILNLGLKQQLTDNLSLFFEASNLTNNGKVESEFGTNGVATSRKSEEFGRTFLFGVNWTF
ncbi:MAG: TonB-dependent receptor [Acaryochloridaceae cyanobacterium CSU_3_4]|nr:TonB-dependent receptor [Acaryochloris sp. SU_5_25]NJN37533.1 TonB-dependent receptor [Acaryochloridaceae cyanobacterium CSU_3_4]